MGKNAAAGPQAYMTQRSGFAVEYIVGESQVLYSFALLGLRHRLRDFPRHRLRDFRARLWPRR